MQKFHTGTRTESRQREHELSEDCWCKPTREYVSPAAVDIRHKETP